VRRLHDTEDAHIYVTGSSSHLLSREIATGLRGRSVSFEVFPLSFPEFLAFRGSAHQPYSRSSEARMAAALDEYLATGGLPEVVLADEDLRQRILKEYVDLVFYKDLVERYRVGNPLVMRQLLRHCLESPASLFNAHKLYQTSGRRASRSRKTPSTPTPATWKSRSSCSCCRSPNDRSASRR